MLITTVLLAAALPASLPAPQEDASAIRAADMRAHISFLASDQLEGRESGERGGKMAARYFAKQWEKLGLKPVGDGGSYLLPFRATGKECLNTAGLLPGTDPGLANQILVVGGHHDHAGIGGPGGMGAPGEIHNGADDNASGSSGVAELAEYFAKRPLRRPVLFMTFGAEESGLLGSKAFVDSGPIPRERLWAMINLDMIGRSVDDYLFVGGLGTALEFHEILDEILDHSSLSLEIKDEGQAPSDNTSFYLAEIPALFFFTHIHEDYHLPSDDAERINYDGAVKILELVREVMEALDGYDGALTFEEAPGQAMPDDFGKRMMEHFQRIQEKRRNRGRLGLSVGELVEEGLLVSRVSSSSAAEAAGLRAGDVLARIDGKEVRSREDLRRALGGKQKGAQIRVEVFRDGRPMGFAVTLK